jgi:hypothetical protein
LPDLDLGSSVASKAAENIREQNNNLLGVSFYIYTGLKQNLTKPGCLLSMVEITRQIVLQNIQLLHDVSQTTRRSLAERG